MKEADIERLLDKFEQSSLSDLQLHDDQFDLVLSKSGHSGVVTPPTSESPIETPAGSTPPNDQGTSTPDRSQTDVTAPLVGIVYLAPRPEESVFKHIGDPVKAGEVVCVIEAMKMVNEIKSPADGIIADILVEDGVLVEYGQPLMIIDEGATV